MSAGISLGGRPVDRIMNDRRHGLVSEVVEEIARRVDLYGQLPDDVIDVDVRHVVHENLSTFQAGLAGRGLSEATLQDLAHSAYRRADEGIPLQLVQEAYLVGARKAWNAIGAEAGPGDAEALREMGSLLLEHLAEVLSAVSSAYLDELRSQVDQVQARRAGLVHALLQGEGVDDAARAADVELAPRYAVLSFSVEPAVQPGLEGPGRRVAERRTLREMRAVLMDQADDLLLRLDPRGGTVLLPQEATGRPWSAHRVQILVDQLIHAGGGPIHAGVAEADVERVHEAAREAHDVLEVALRTGRPPGLHHLSDVLLEYQLSRPGPGAEAMRGRVAALEDQPVLRETLRTFLRLELSRTATAAALHVHANTVDYRLGRVRALTGLDPGVASELTLLRAGLLVT